MIRASSVTSSEASMESAPHTPRRRKEGLAVSSIPFAYPKRPFATAFEHEVLRRFAREDRAAEEARNLWEMEKAETILFHRARGMSEATLIARFGKELVTRVLEASKKTESIPVAA